MKKIAVSIVLFLALAPVGCGGGSSVPAEDSQGYDLTVQNGKVSCGSGDLKYVSATNTCERVNLP